MPQLDGSDDDEMSESGGEVMLGFVEEVDKPAALLRHRFPSKVGGRPAWLDPVHLPGYNALSCPFTGKPLQFLLQVYAPIEDIPDAFHRTLMLFVSAEGDRLKEPGAVRAFRCQLPRQNPFYSYHPPKDRDIGPPALKAADLEAALKGDPWRVVEAEEAVARGGQAATADGERVAMFPEWELVVEPEECEEGEEGEGLEGARADPMVARALEEYRQRVEVEGELDEDELPDSVMEQVQDGVDAEQQHFAEFQARIASAPEQVLRYSFQAASQPLWPSTSHRPQPQDIPPCPLCNAPRQFELQVLPQLLNCLGINDLDPHAHDWGTIAVYSCSKSCTPGLRDGCAYAEEVCWVQPP